jgi:hypothetical protein
VRNLPGGLGCQEKKGTESLSVIRGSGLSIQKQDCDQISPTQELTPQSGTPMRIDREVRQVERPLVCARSPLVVPGLRQLPRPVHFIANHQNLLIQRK